MTLQMCLKIPLCIVEVISRIQTKHLVELKISIVNHMIINSSKCNHKFYSFHLHCELCVVYPSVILHTNAYNAYKPILLRYNA